MKAKVWKGNDEQWYWHFESKGRTTADSEGFPSKGNAVRAAKGVITAIFRACSTGHGVQTIVRLDPSFTVSKEVDGVVWIKWSIQL